MSDGIVGFHDCDTCNIIKFGEDDLVDITLLSPEACLLLPHKSGKLSISTKLGNVLDLEIKSCRSISTIQEVKEEQKSSFNNKLMLHK